MLTATKTEGSHTLDLLKEKKVVHGDGHQGTLHGPAKITYQPVADGDSQHLHPKIGATAERGCVMDDIYVEYP